jgi:hypothetical protein
LDQQAVLFANEAFYRAFTARDVKAMDTIWARAAPVACIHPGWGVLVGREAVMESWVRILSSPGAPQIVCRDASAFVLGSVAWVICFEAIGDNFLIATNLFVWEDGAWHLAHHQAGPTVDRPDDEEGPGQASVH